jgi:hypothetical protein
VSLLKGLGVGRASARHLYSPGWRVCDRLRRHRALLPHSNFQPVELRCYMHARPGIFEVVFNNKTEKGDCK